MHGDGLQRFYQLGGGRGAAVGAVPSPARRDWLEELITASPATVEGTAAAEVTLDVQGIRCAACVWVIQELWQRRAGGHRVAVNPARGRVRFLFDPATLNLNDFLDDVERLGYRFGPPSRSGSAGDRGVLARLGVCAALAMNAMVFAFAGYVGLTEAEGPLHGLFAWLSMGLSTVSVLVGGPVFFRAAWSGLRQRALHLDLPIALGIGLAWSGSLWSFLAGSGASYFDTVTVFVALMLAGRYLQLRALARNREFVLENDGAQHLRVRRVRDGRIELVAVLEVEPGDELVSAPGDLVPVHATLLSDGAAVAGDREGAEFSLDWIRGESEPPAFCGRGRRPRWCVPCRRPRRTSPRASGRFLVRARRDADNAAQRQGFGARGSSRSAFGVLGSAEPNLRQCGAGHRGARCRGLDADRPEPCTRHRGLVAGCDLPVCAGDRDTPRIRTRADRTASPRDLRADTSTAREGQACSARTSRQDRHVDLGWPRS